MILDNTFNDPSIYKTLPAIASMMNKLDEHKRAHLSRLINSYTNACSRVREIPDPSFRIHIMQTVVIEHEQKVMAMDVEPALISHVRNYIVTCKKRIDKGARAEIAEISKIKRALSVVDVIPKKFQRMKAAYGNAMEYLEKSGKLDAGELDTVKNMFKNAIKD